MIPPPLLRTKFLDTRNFKNDKKGPFPIFFTAKQEIFFFLYYLFLYYLLYCSPKFLQQTISGRNFQQHQRLPEIQKAPSINVSYHDTVRLWDKKFSTSSGDTLLWYTKTLAIYKSAPLNLTCSRPVFDSVQNFSKKKVNSAMQFFSRNCERRHNFLLKIS